MVVTLDFLVPGHRAGDDRPGRGQDGRRAGAAGRAARIGDVYFFGAVGSIVGTFLAGFVLMYLAPTSTIVMLVAAALALLAARS